MAPHAGGTAARCSGGRTPRGGRTRAGLALLTLLAAAPCLALNPARRLTQYAHTAWRIEDGAFGATPNALAQTADGYLWIGTDAGLVRFDGVRFLPWEPPAGQQLPNPGIFSLRGTRDGSLWIGTAAGLARWRNGVLWNYTTGRGYINAILEDPDGNVWFSRSRPAENSGPICRVEGDRARCYGKPEGVPFALVGPLRREGNGDFWGGSPEGLFRWRPGFSEVHLTDRLAVAAGLPGVSALATGPGGTLRPGHDAGARGTNRRQAADLHESRSRRRGGTGGPRPAAVCRTDAGAKQPGHQGQESLPAARRPPVITNGLS